MYIKYTLKRTEKKEILRIQKVSFAAIINLTETTTTDIRKNSSLTFPYCLPDVTSFMLATCLLNRFVLFYNTVSANRFTCNYCEYFLLIYE